MIFFFQIWLEIDHPSWFYFHISLLIGILVVTKQHIQTIDFLSDLGTMSRSSISLVRVSRGIRPLTPAQGKWRVHHQNTNRTSFSNGGGCLWILHRNTSCHRWVPILLHDFIYVCARLTIQTVSHLQAKVIIDLNRKLVIPIHCCYEKASYTFL